MLFGKKKNAKLSQTELQILENLEGLSFVDDSGRISREELEEYRRAVDSVRICLEQRQIQRLDVSGINTQILFLTEYLPDAIRCGNVDTARLTVRALNYGVLQARKDVDLKDLTRAEEIVRIRLRRLSLWRECIDLSVRKFELSISLENLRRTRDTYFGDYERCRDALRKICVERPELVRELEELGAHSNRLSTDAKGIVTLKNQIAQLCYHIQQLDRQMEEHRAAIAQKESEIRAAELCMNDRALADQLAQQEQQALLELDQRLYRMAEGQWQEQSAPAPDPGFPEEDPLLDTDRRLYQMTDDI